MTTFQFSMQFMLPLQQINISGQKIKNVLDFMFVGLGPADLLKLKNSSGKREEKDFYVDDKKLRLFPIKLYFVRLNSEASQGVKCVSQFINF